MENGIADFIKKNEASTPVQANVASSFLQNSNLFLSPTEYDSNFQENYKMHGGIEVGDKIVFGFAKNELSSFVDPSFTVAAKQYEESGLPSSISLLQDSSPYHHSGGKRPIFPETPVRGIMKHSDVHRDSQQLPSKSSDEYTKRRRSFSDGEGGSNFNYATLSEVQSQRDDGLHKVSDLRHSASSSSQQQHHSHSPSLNNQPEPVAVPLVVGATYTIQLDGSGCPIMVPWTAPFHQSVRSTSPMSSSTFLRTSAHGSAHRSAAVPQLRRSFAGAASNRPARQNFTASYTVSHNSLPIADETPRYYATASKVKPAESKFQSIYKEYYSLSNSEDVDRARPPLSVKSASTTPSKHQQEMPMAFSTPTFSHVPPPPLYSSPMDPTSLSEARQSEFWRKRLASRELTTVLR